MTFTASRSPGNPCWSSVYWSPAIDLLVTLIGPPRVLNKFLGNAQITRRSTDPLPQRLHRASTGTDRQTRKPTANQQDMVGQLKGQVERQSAATAQLQQQYRPTAGHNNHRPPTLHVSLCFRVSTRRHRSLSRASMDWAPVIMDTMAGRGVRASTTMAITDDIGRLVTGSDITNLRPTD